MPKDPNGNKVGSEEADLLWGSALVVGPELDNGIDTIYGLGGDDVIFGDIYNDGSDNVEGDVLYGGAGNDTIYGDGGDDNPNWQTSTDGGSDSINGGADDDSIFGQAGNDQLYGDAGNDLLVGGIGSDYLYGGEGDDIIWTDLHQNLGAIGAQGLNRAWGGSGNDKMTGGAGVDELYGEDGNDTLDGRAGEDELEGGAGDDRLRGGDNDDLLDGGNGNDYLDGGAGADYLYTGGGNDTYVIDNVGDEIAPYSDSGRDHVMSSVTWQLGEYQENLFLNGSKAVDATGNAGRNILAGNSKANEITGLGGRDTLIGGTGADTFVFTGLQDSGKTASTRDVIDDFKRSQGDEIDLSAIDANTKNGGNQAFKFIGSQDFHDKAGELRFEKQGGDTFVYGDVNGDGEADFSIEFDGAMNLKAGDFAL